MNTTTSNALKINTEPKLELVKCNYQVVTTLQPSTPKRIKEFFKMFKNPYYIAKVLSEHTTSDDWMTSLISHKEPNRISKEYYDTEYGKIEIEFNNKTKTTVHTPFYTYIIPNSTVEATIKCAKLNMTKSTIDSTSPIFQLALKIIGRKQYNRLKEISKTVWRPSDIQFIAVQLLKTRYKATDWKRPALKALRNRRSEIRELNLKKFGKVYIELSTKADDTLSAYINFQNFDIHYSTSNEEDPIYKLALKAIKHSTN